MKSNDALIMAGLMTKRSVDWLGGALDAAGMAPMPVVGGLANAANSALEFGRGNWRGGLTNAAMIPLGMFGLGGIGKGVQMGAKALRFGAKSAPLMHGIETAGKWIQKVPGATGALGNTAQFAGEGMKYVPGQTFKNVGRFGLNTFGGGGKIINPTIRVEVKRHIAGPSMAAQNAVAQEDAESGMQRLGQAATNAFGSYGAQAPGNIGPHNPNLFTGPGY